MHKTRNPHRDENFDVGLLDSEIMLTCFEAFQKNTLNPEDGGTMFLWNVGISPQIHIV